MCFSPRLKDMRKPHSKNSRDFWYVGADRWQAWCSEVRYSLKGSSNQKNAKNNLRKFDGAGRIMETNEGVPAMVTCDTCARDPELVCRVFADVSKGRICAYCRCRGRTGCVTIPSPPSDVERLEQVERSLAAVVQTVATTTVPSTLEHRVLLLEIQLQAIQDGPTPSPLGDRTAMLERQVQALEATTKSASTRKPTTHLEHQPQTEDHVPEPYSLEHRISELESRLQSSGASTVQNDKIGLLERQLQAMQSMVERQARSFKILESQRETSRIEVASLRDDMSVLWEKSFACERTLRE